MAFEPHGYRAGRVQSFPPVPQVPLSAMSPHPRPPTYRVPLARNRRRLSYDVRLRVWLSALCLPPALCAGVVAWLWLHSVDTAVLSMVATGLGFWWISSTLFSQLTRPLQTLANVVAALREDDFSFRARGARRGDSLGDLALEINGLANSLQLQRSAARDAITLAERVMDAMRTPVLAFTEEGTLQLVNPAAESAFTLRRQEALGQPATSLGLASLLQLPDGAVYTQHAVSGVAGETRWSLRRSGFRLNGVPQQLLVFSDVNAALREEERIAWQRLVRVLSHEINNSLTPITSIAGSLRSRLGYNGLPADAEDHQGPQPQLDDLRCGLQLIEQRALSLHRFLQAYQQLSRVPQPMLQPVEVGDLVRRVIALETRLPVTLEESPSITVPLDPAQMEQLLINLLRNATEAALSAAVETAPASVHVRWFFATQQFILQVEDNGPGISETANLFVPFYTTKPDGNGIGLALAKQIASGHNGTLSLRNRDSGPGCIAELRLTISSQSVNT